MGAKIADEEAQQQDEEAQGQHPEAKEVEGETTQALAKPRTAKFVTGSLMRHVSVMSFTSSVGLMCMFGVDLVDLVFISMLGNEALAAAVGYAGAIVFFTTSISIGVMIATGALVSRALGSGDTQTVYRVTTSVFIFSLILGVCIGLVRRAIVSPGSTTAFVTLGCSGRWYGSAWTRSFAWLVPRARP